MYLLFGFINIFNISLKIEIIGLSLLVLRFKIRFKVSYNIEKYQTTKRDPKSSCEILFNFWRLTIVEDFYVIKTHQELKKELIKSIK